MIKDLKVIENIKINSTPEQIWNALTNPEKIKVYLFGTETITDWKEGSSIVFQGEYQGHQYKDKGNVLGNKKNRFLQYNYWSGFSGLEDKPENYSIISLDLKENEDHVELTWTQEGFATEEGHKHTENGLPAMLQQIKKLAEKSD
ncbi:MAG: ATPase [Crocinitomicaceae bacterium]|nr:ATPase [Crocinitomicaceae bacterium]|tara:strand:- start:596 stop:1030 length:435 start_codon:yes stop_codon:yes gene_type:complete